MVNNPKAQNFLDALNRAQSKTESPAAIAHAPGRQKSSSDPGRKHIGGYFDPELVEKFAVLKARLRLDNSELIKLAINRLWADEEARRAFGE